jgi:hypothetical protein
MTDDFERRQREARELEEARRRVDEERRLREQHPDNRPIAKDLHGGDGKGDRPTGSGTE